MIQLGNGGGITGVGTIYVGNLHTQFINVNNLSTPDYFQVSQYILSSANIIVGINGNVFNNDYKVITTPVKNTPYLPVNANKTKGIILQTTDIFSGNINIRTGATSSGSESICWPFSNDMYYNSIIMSTVPGSTGIFYISPQENPNYSLTIGATGNVNVAGTLTCNRYNGPYYIRGTCPTTLSSTTTLTSLSPSLYQFYKINTNSAITITLPSSSLSSYEGSSCWFKRQNGNNTFTINSSSTAVIYQLSSITLTNSITISFQCLLYCDGTNWNVLVQS